ncbi:hypothetical protein BGW41_007560 [Actinomortierella wolfii]|nr:hypothetical protein BGW41_007560 [Actinomortierella wolfii]
MQSSSSKSSESYYADTSFGVGKAGFDSSRASHPKKHDRWMPNNSLLHTGPKRWRWWNYLAALLLIFASIETVIFLLGSKALYSLPEQIRIDSREFRNVTYQGLVLDPSATYKKPIQVYHVTKEFGPASMGGLGMVVTALAVAQQRARVQKVNIVLPYYTMLDKLNLDIKPFTTLSMEIKDNRQRTREVTFQVHRFKYEFPVPESEQNDPTKRRITPVAVWLIGRADMYPFDRAFESKNVQEIYYSPRGLPGEWKDLYFAKAAATFIQRQNKNNEVSLFAPAASRGDGVDIVHIHGATNAFVLQYLQQAIDRGYLGEAPPALVYTLHDYMDELQYSNEIKNVEKFMDRHIHSNDDEEDLILQMENIAPYCHGHRMFTSAMGVDLADMVTFVSKTMAKDIVEGRLDFYLKELVLGSILNRASKNQFVGITNGIDFSKLNPWTMPQLRSNQLDFPPMEGATFLNNEQPTLNEDGTAVSYKSSNPTIREAKEAAKYFLKSKGFLTEQDLEKPLVLFIGRFQYNKGLEFFATACQAIKERGGRFVIMGQPNNFPMKSINNLERLYKGTVSVISEPKVQDEWGVYWRAAADFLLVPSLTESFGLVAAEGLLFGSTIISSGVGGLSEFLVDRPNPDDPQQQQEDRMLEKQQQLLPQDQLQPILSREERFNSYLFDALAPDAHSLLTVAIRDAIQHWRTLQTQPQQHEAFLQRLVSSALAMGWDRPGGPVDQYRALYEIALDNISGGEASL